jgi:putative Mn2+ efflux pump MntP
MFGKLVRAPLAIGAAVLFSAIIQFVGPLMLPLIGSEGGYLYNGFSGIIDNALFIMLVAVGAGVLARAVTESNAGVR